MEASLDDLKELKRLLSFGTTPYIEAFLQRNIRILESNFGIEPEREEAPPPAPPEPEEYVEPVVVENPFENIIDYVWHEEWDHIEIILENIEQLGQSTIIFDPKELSVTVKIIREGLGLPNLKFHKEPFLHELKINLSEYFIKDRNFVMQLQKKKKGWWGHFIETEEDRYRKVHPLPPIPEQKKGLRLTQILRDHYERQDDEGKRAIERAQYEQLQKQKAGYVDPDAIDPMTLMGMGGMPGGPGPGGFPYV